MLFQLETFWSNSFLSFRSRGSRIPNARSMEESMLAMAICSQALALASGDTTSMRRQEMWQFSHYVLQKKLEMWCKHVPIAGKLL